MSAILSRPQYINKFLFQVLANDSEKLSKEYADSDVLPKPEHW